MSGHRSRAYSPPRNPRASTGQVYVTAFDTSTSTMPGRTSSSSVAGRQNIVYEAQPIRKSHDGKTSRTEYAVRPRQDSVTGTENKRPLTVLTKASSPSRRGSAVVASPREILSPAVVRDDSSRFLQPASSLSPRQPQHHQRHNSTTTTDLNGYISGNRDRRDRIYHPQSRSTTQPSQKQYYSGRAQPPRYQDEEGWSYTGPREQFDRDYPQRPEPRRDGQSRKERPVNVYERDRPPAKREIAAPAPQSSNRQLARIEKDSPARYSSRSGFDSEPDRYTDAPRRRQSLKTPVLHQHYQDQDDAYSSAREGNEPRSHHRVREDRYEDEPRRRDRHKDSNRDPDRDRDRDHRRDYDRPSDRDRVREHDRSERGLDSRRKPRSRDPSPERSTFKTIAAGALGSLATAGTLGMLRKDTKEKEVEPEADENKEHRHRRRRRHRKSEDVSEESDAPESRRMEGQTRSRRYDDSESETPEDQASRRERPRRRHRDEEAEPEQRDDVDREREHERERPRRRHRDEDVDQGRRQDIDRDRDRDQRPRSSSRARFQDDVPADSGTQIQEPISTNRPEYQPQDLETRTMSPGENEDDRPRRVQLVEPVKENQEAKPKGILKPARQVPFPEDPNPIREGVAPLKDATKDGVPVNARWTKINRVLVNPEALEKYHERFEEREDYVIVLRVLSKEEIQKLAEKTKEIRETREREWKRKLDERKRHQSEPDGNGDTDYTDYDSEQEDRPQLAIEAGPPAPPVDLRNLQQQPLHQDAPQTIPSRNMPGGIPVTDDFDRNYSMNV